MVRQSISLTLMLESRKKKKLTFTIRTRGPRGAEI